MSFKSKQLSTYIKEMKRRRNFSPRSSRRARRRREEKDFYPRRENFTFPKNYTASRATLVEKGPPNQDQQPFGNRGGRKERAFASSRITSISVLFRLRLQSRFLRNREDIESSHF
jgi:hypothetical protein